MTRAVVFANGDCSENACEIAQVSKEDYLVCVDGGIRHCISAGLQPDLLVGDFDSLGENVSFVASQEAIEQVRFPVKKNASDLELTLHSLCERSINEVVILGASGGRTDHHLFNWQLAASRSWPFNLRLVDDFVDARIVDVARPLKLSIPIGQTFSVVPLVQGATGVEVVGALYPLSNATLAPGSTLGLSNEITSSHVQVSLSSGIVLVMLVHTMR